MEQIAVAGNPVEAQTEVVAPIDVNKIVGGINALAIKTVELGGMEIGEYVLDELFQGNLSEAFSKNPYKSTSLKDVCKNPDLMVNPKTLGGWIKAADLRRTLTAQDVDCSKLTLSHYGELLRVEDQVKRNDFAKQASEVPWSVRTLKQKVDKTHTAGATVEGHAERTAKEFIKFLENPLVYSEDNASRKDLMDPNLLTEKLESGHRIKMVKVIDKSIAKIMRDLSFLKTTKTHLVRIELGEPEPEVV